MLPKTLQLSPSFGIPLILGVFAHFALFPALLTIS
jgi:hypothetical protein